MDKKVFIIKWDTEFVEKVQRIIDELHVSATNTREAAKRMLERIHRDIQAATEDMGAALVSMLRKIESEEEKNVMYCWKFYQQYFNPFNTIEAGYFGSGFGTFLWIRRLKKWCRKYYLILIKRLCYSVVFHPLSAEYTPRILVYVRQWRKLF